MKNPLFIPGWKSLGGNTRGTRGGALGVFRDFGVPRVLGASGVAGILEFGEMGASGVPVTFQKPTRGLGSAQN